MINIGIVGFGFMGHTHAKMFSTIDEINLVAVADTNPEQLLDAPEGVFRFDSIEELLSADIDTVLISTPNPSHLSMVIACAEAGKDIICEKPVAMNTEELDRMTAAAKEHGVMFTIHQQRRWDKDYRIMKEIYDGELVGDMYVIKSQLYGFNGYMHDWHVYPEMGGGMLYDWGVHLIDQILDMVDSRICSVFAECRNVINESVDDYFNIHIKFANGVLAEIELGTYYLTPKRAWFIGGNKGSAVTCGFDGGGRIIRTTKLLENVPNKITMTAAGPTRSFGPPPEGLLIEEKLPVVSVSHRQFFENYIKAKKGEEALLVTPMQARRVLEVMKAVRESADTCEAIHIE